jgi:hypothetical protein
MKDKERVEEIKQDLRSNIGWIEVYRDNTTAICNYIDHLEAELKQADFNNGLLEKKVNRLEEALEKIKHNGVCYCIEVAQQALTNTQKEGG